MISLAGFRGAEIAVKVDITGALIAVGDSAGNALNTIPLPPDWII